MKRILTGTALLLCSVGAAAQHCIPSGVTDQYTYFVAVDANDLVTRETGLSSFTVYRSRNGGAASAFTTPTVNETDSSNMPGVYELLLDKDMTIGAGNDVEHMVLHITADGMAPVTKEICIARPKITAGETLAVDSGVGTANTTQWGGTAVASVAVSANVTQISGDSGAADALEVAFDGTAGPVPTFGIARQGVAQSATSTTLVLDSGATFADDVPIGMTLVACGTTQGYCQSRAITDYTAATNTATVEAWGVTPSGTITYYLFGTAPGDSGGGLDAAGVRAAIGLSSANLDTQLSGIASDAGDAHSAIDALAADIGSNGAGLTELPWNVAWDAEVQREALDALNAYDPPTNAEMVARTLAAADYATATNLATVDSVVDGIKAVTDNLPDSGALTSLATAAALSTVDGVVDAIKVTTDKLDDTLEDPGNGTYRFTEAALAQAPAGGGGEGGTDWDADERTAIRSILGIPASGTTPDDPSSGILDTIRDSIAGLNDLDAGEAQAAAAAALGAYDPPTRAELTNDIESVLSAIAALPPSIRDLEIEDAGEGVTLGCALAALVASAAGDVTTIGATSVFEDPSGSEARITGTVTSPGNRDGSISCPQY